MDRETQKYIDDGLLIDEDSRNLNEDLKEDNLILDDLIETFGLLNSPLDSDATYILKDGRILDTGREMNDHQHLTIANYISDKYHRDDIDENNGSRFMRDIGAIRVTPWVPAFYLGRDMPTAKQEETLLKMLDEGKEIWLDELMVATEDGSQQIDIDINNESSEDILDRIFNYYYTGRLN